MFLIEGKIKLFRKKGILKPLKIPNILYATRLEKI